MIATPTSTSNKTTKVKSPKEGGFCVFSLSFFWVLFCNGLGFFFYVSCKPNFFFIIKNLVITYKLIQ